MDIIYLTTAVNDEYYKRMLTYFPLGLNTSNQNFHYRMINSLSLNNKVNVLSFRAYSKAMIKNLKISNEKEKNINWNYLKLKNNKYLRYISFIKESLMAIKEIKNATIFVDSLNVTLTKIAYLLAKKHNFKVIEVVTDSPFNISFTNKKYKKNVLNLAKKADGFVVLTKELNEMFNINNKPSTIVQGIIESNNNRNAYKYDFPYFFFAGAMLPAFGLYNLIDAFKQIDSTYHLFIAGHHYDEKLLNNAIGNSKNIHFLKTLDYEEIIKYENGAVANINPRPLNKEFDLYSVPSKTIEYANSSSITISTYSSQLYNLFEDSIIWTNEGTSDQIKDALIKVINISKEEKESKIKNANFIANKLFSYQSINKILNNLITKIIK